MTYESHTYMKKASESYRENRAALCQFVSMSLDMHKIKRLLGERGADQSDLARHLGISSQAVNQWFRVDGTHPDPKRWADIAKFFNLTVLDIMETVPVASVAASSLPPSNVRLAPDAPPLPTRFSMDRNIPVYGTGQGGEDGVFHLNREDGPIDWARRPPGLVGVDKAFAIYLEGDSMRPWRRPGDLIYAHDGRPANIGDYVIVVVRSADPGEEPRAWVKELVRRTATKMILRQHNPPKEITLDINRIDKIYRVYEMNELLTA